MRTRNFPAKKLKRQLIASGMDVSTEESKVKLSQARANRTKKRRSV